MNGLIGRFVTDRGAEQTAARSAVGVIPALLVKEDPADAIRAGIEALPGTDDTAYATRSDNRLGECSA